MGSHFRFGNHWFPRFRTKVTYLDNHSFQIRDESMFEADIPVNPVFLKEVFSYLENILVLGQQQSWSDSWMPPLSKPEAGDAKKKGPSLIGTPVCALDRHNRWYLGKIAANVSSASDKCYIEWDNLNFCNEPVDGDNVVPRVRQPIQEPRRLLGRTVLVASPETTRLEKVVITSLMEDKTTGQLIYKTSDSQVFMPENVRGILLPEPLERE